jgi:NAD(P)-dependent dehydrogenase (short-subunit alcohol dehydrogenase family)
VTEKVKRNVLITGCSSGFGFMTSLKLAESGFNVYATMRNMDKSDLLRDETEKRNLTLHIMELDVTDTASIEKALDEIEKEDGRLSFLINNAGYGLGGFFEDISDREFRDQMETNFFGVLNVTRQALPLMRKAKSGKIINISSISGLTAFPGVSAYHASKWALEGLSESLRHELKPFNIEVILIEPGAYKTKVLKKNIHVASRSFNPESPYYLYNQKVLEEFNRRTGKLRNNVEVVPNLIARLLKRKRNRLRHIVGSRAKATFLMTRILPFRVYEWAVYKYLFSKIKEQ